MTATRPYYQRSAAQLGLVLSLVSVGANAGDSAPASYPEHVFFGDTHVHTALSADAYGMGTRLMPEQAYRFAKGEAVIASGGQTAQLRRPLDFLLVADHAENLGVIQAIHANDPALSDSDDKQSRATILNSTPALGDVLNAPTYEAYKAGSNALLSAKGAKEGEYDTPLAFHRSVWQSVVAMAERHNDPGTFTTFAGFEWSATDPGPIHRNVLFADGPELTGRILPFSAYDSPDVEDLWAYLEDYESKLQGGALAIPHNGNLSRGGTFALRTYQGDPLSEDYATRRARWEPLYEVTQIKGDGETHPRLSSADEFADFETWPPAPMSEQIEEHRKKDDAKAKLPAADREPGLQASYARSALKNGLNLQVELGANPFKFGMIGSTDSHNGLATADSDNFWGKMASNEPGPYRAIDQWYYTASGYAAVWAEENTRDSLFAAMRRKETYATTGPRMVVRFFGGWDYEATDAASVEFAAIGYAKGVPMGGDLIGGDLSRAESGKAPRFLIAAAKDPDGANLDRIQIIKGWRDGAGDLQEKVIDVALSDSRRPAADGSVDIVGSTVNVNDASYSNSIGAAELATVWTDPDFDADDPAFYYVRVLEIPTPRWTAYDAKTYSLKDLPEELPMVLQERAYTAPIWYTP